MHALAVIPTCASLRRHRGSVAGNDFDIGSEDLQRTIPIQPNVDSAPTWYETLSTKVQVKS